MLQKCIPGAFVEALIAGEVLRFFVHNPADIIQRHHAKGEFYEAEELALMFRYMTPQTRYLDIGTNVGNHVIYLARCGGLRDIVVIEPNGPAIAILQINLSLNAIGQFVDTSYLGYGLSDGAYRGNMVAHKDNLGGAHFVDAADGPFQLVTGDALLGDRSFDFIKIDTEGMEIKCLHGLDALIRRCRPTLFVEVDNANVPAFLAWCSSHDYVVAERFRRYTANENYLATPS